MERPADSHCMDGRNGLFVENCMWQSILWLQQITLWPMQNTLTIPKTPSFISWWSVQLLSSVWLFVTPWIAAPQASLSITNYQSLLKLTPIESVMPLSHLILCHPLLFLPPTPPGIRVFSNESALLMRWPKYWNFSFSISSSNEHPGLISFRMDE